MKFYKKVLLLCILILSGLLSSSSISRADTFTISATDSYLVDGPTFNEELINAMKKVGSDSVRCNYITSIDLIDEPFTSEINVAQNGDVNKIVQKMIGNKGEYFAYYTAIYYGGF